VLLEMLHGKMPAVIERSNIAKHNDSRAASLYAS
jgi:hypothetical protein